MYRLRPVLSPAAWLLPLVCGLVALAAPAFAAPGAVRLIAADPTAVRFEVSVPAPRWEALAAPGQESDPASRLVLDGYESDVPAGEPAVPARIVVVAVPPFGAVRVGATGLDPEVRDGVLLAPQPGADREDRSGTPRYARSAGAYAAAGPLPGVRARLLEVGWLRNQRIARVVVLPADYDAAQRRLTLYRRVEVDLQVEPAGAGGPPAEETDPFEPVYRDALINYEQGRDWRRPRQPGPAGHETLSPAALGALSVAVPESSVFVGRTWVKIAVQNTGFYRLDFSQVRGFSLFNQDTTTRSDSLRLFHWPGFPVLPEDSYCDSCDYREVALGMVDHQDGALGERLFGRNGDYFYFFAMGPSDWASRYDPTRPDTVFINHPYETASYYYLTRATTESPVGGSPLRIATLDGAIRDAGLPTPASFRARAHFELDVEYWPDASPFYASNDRRLFWEKWFWKSLTQGGSFTVPLDLPGADTTQAVRVRALAWGLNIVVPPPGYIKSIRDHFLDMSFNGVPFRPRIFDGLLAQVYDSTLMNLRGAGNALVMSVQNKVDPLNPTRVDRCGLGWADVYYTRFFEPVDDALTFETPAGGSGDVIYRLGPFRRPTMPRVFDVTDDGRPVEVAIPGSQYVALTDTTWQLSFEAHESARRCYQVVRDSSIETVPFGNVAEAAFTSLENLRSRTEQADYLVIYYDKFKAAADSLAEWRQSHLPLPGVTAPYRTRTVPISALYDQFSGGRTDVAAIRNFLRAVFFNWNGGRDNGNRAPAFVTFLGDASYDFKDYTGRAGEGQPGTLVPSYEGGFDGYVSRQFATDDWMLNVDEASIVIPDFYGGRLPVDDAATALGVVRAKVLGYERATPTGEWRNQVLLIADDNFQGERDDPLHWSHVRQTMRLDANFTPPHLDRDYVYLHTYPTGPGSTKPGAKADLVAYMNAGVAFTNYVGHGSPFQLADERVLLDNDVATLSNAPRFTVFISASCDVGKFNDPTVQSLGERLITSTVGGAVGVISATELAFSGANAELNQIIYREVFKRDTVDCHYHVPLAQALLKTKFGAFNEQKYQVMGDAAIVPALPWLWVELALADSAGAPVSEIRRGQMLQFRGRVVDCPGGPPVPYDGVAGLLIEDSQEVNFVQDLVDSTTYYYKSGAIYRGDVGVSHGEVQGRFVVPVESRLGDRGRVRAYIEGRPAGALVDRDGVGVVNLPVVAGEPLSGDDSGPRISLSFVGGATQVRPDAVLSVDLYDPSGILTTGHTPQNGIVVTLDGNSTTRVDITSSFRYAADSYQSGTAHFTLPRLAAGPHNVSVSAADNLAAGLNAGVHRSKASLDFEVVDQPTLRIARAYLFPNPASSRGPGSGGQFVVDAPGDSVNVLLRLYTVSGKLIRTLRELGGMGQVQMPWDGLDEDGQPLANGVYFFRVHVNPREADGRSSPRQKADVDGRFVIVNR